MITIDPINKEQLNNLEDLHISIRILCLAILNYRITFNENSVLHWHANLHAAMEQAQKELQQVNVALKSLGLDEIELQYPTDAAPEISTSELM